MTRTTPPRPPPRPAAAAEELDRVGARRILAQMGENGKPPELGITHVNVGNESYLRVIDSVYVQDLICTAEGSSFKLVQGTYGAGKTHFLYCVRDLAWRRRLGSSRSLASQKEGQPDGNAPGSSEESAARKAVVRCRHVCLIGRAPSREMRSSWPPM